MNPLQAVSREIRKILTERANNFNIALDDVSITSLSFGKEFTHAIEAKQVAAQEAERAKFIVEKAEQDKRSAIIRAQVTLSSISNILSLTCISEHYKEQKYVHRTSFVIFNMFVVAVTCAETVSTVFFLSL